MSAISEPTASPAAAPAAPAAPVTPKGPSLPSGVNLNKNYDASEFFEKHKAANSPAAPSAPVAPAAIAPAPTPAAPSEPTPAPAAPKASDLASQLTGEVEPKPDAKPAEAPPAAPVENPEDKVQLDAKYSAPAHDSFKQIKGIAKGLREQLVSRDRELQEAKAEITKIKSGATPVESPEFSRLKQEHEAMSKRLMVLDLESHPKFQQEFVAPRSAAEQEARNILEAAGVSGVDIANLLSKDPVSFRKDLSAIAAKLPTALDQADFATAMRTAHTLALRGREAVTKAGEINSALKAQALNGYKSAFDDVYQTTVGSLNLKELTTPPGEKPEVVAQIERFNQSVRNLRTEAESIALGTSDPKSIARASIHAAAYKFQMEHVMPILKQTLGAQAGRIAELEARLKGIAGRNPNAQVRGTPGDGSAVDPSKMDHKQAAEYFAGLGRGGG